MFCKNCGAEIGDDADFCLHCGKATKELGKVENSSDSSLSSKDIKVLLIAGVSFLIVFGFVMMWVFANK